MGEIAALSAAALWAAASLIFSRLSREHGPLAMNTLKCVLGLGLTLATLLFLEGIAWPVISTRDTMILLVSGFVGLTLGDTSYFHSLAKLGARRTLLIMALVPPVTALAAWPLLGEVPTARMAVGVAVTLAGVVWVVTERTAGSTGADAPQKRELALGVLFALGAVLGQSSGNVLTKLGAAEASGIGISAVRLAAGALGLVAYVAIRGDLGRLRAPFRTPGVARWLGLATFLGTFLGIWLLNVGLKYSSHTGVAATLSSTSPIFVLPLAWVFVGERLSARSVTGAFVAVGGIALLVI